MASLSCSALRCLEAMAAGHTERAALAAIPDLPQSAVPTAGGGADVAASTLADLESDPFIAQLLGPPGLPAPGVPGRVSDAVTAGAPDMAAPRKAGGTTAHTTYSSILHRVRCYMFGDASDIELFSSNRYRSKQIHTYIVSSASLLEPHPSTAV